MNYVALGDSYASGGGLAPSLAYPVLLGAQGPGRFASPTSAARSGAVTSDVLATQVSSLRESTRTVTLTVGGNDAGFATVVVVFAVLAIAAVLGLIGRGKLARPNTGAPR